MTVMGVLAGLAIAIPLGIYTFVTSMKTTLHPDPSAVPSVAGATASSRWTAAVDRARHEALTGLVAHNLPGLSVAVGVDGDLIWSEGFGYADLERQIPVSPAMRFRIGHVSKALTSAAVGLLLEQDRLRLGAGIQTYVPDYPGKERPVTLRELMAHVAGVRHYRGDGDFTLTTHCDRAADGLRLFADDALLFEPGTQYRYSTYGWILVSAAVEAASGQPFFAFMRRAVFEPLGMTGTTVDSPSDPIAERVTFYYPRFSGDPGSGSNLAEAANYSCFAGAGALLSTPTDLVRFGNALIAGDFLDRRTVQRLQTPQLLASGQETEYGLGWMLHTVPLAGRQVREAGHASLTLLGGSTSFLTFPDERLVVAVTANTSRAATRSIALTIAEAFAGTPSGR